VGPLALPDESAVRQPFVDETVGKVGAIELGGNVLLAYGFPLLSVFWTLLMFAGFILWIFIVIWCFIDNFRRRDHHGVAKALWFVFIVFVPVIGVIAYIIARPSAADLENVT
jgi:phage shock protein PspC (stress-responsive transcriptional regulator)